MRGESSRSAACRAYRCSLTWRRTDPHPTRTWPRVNVVLGLRVPLPPVIDNDGELALFLRGGSGAFATVDVAVGRRGRSSPASGRISASLLGTTAGAAAAVVAEGIVGSAAAAAAAAISLLGGGDAVARQ